MLRVQAVRVISVVKGGEVSGVSRLIRLAKRNAYKLPVSPVPQHTILQLRFELFGILSFEAHQRCLAVLTKS
jgi:hypothetical protein